MPMRLSDDAAVLGSTSVDKHGVKVFAKLRPEKRRRVKVEGEVRLFSRTDRNREWGR